MLASLLGCRHRATAAFPH